MSKEELKLINEKWNDQTRNDEYEGYFVYEPFSESYWTEENKIVICNLESYDDTYEKEKRLDLAVFRSWFGNRRSRTPPMTGVIIKTIFNLIENKSIYSADEMRKIYKDKGMIIDTIKRITYMNLRKEIGNQVNEDIYSINKYINPSFTSKDNNNLHNIMNLKDFIKALEPKIFIITSEIGADIISKIYKKEMKLVFGSYASMGETLVVSIKHPRCISYKEIIKMSVGIKEYLKI